MNLLKIICSNIVVLIHHCMEKVESKTLLTHDDFYPEYVPDRQPWLSAHMLCLQRSGTLAVVSSTEEIQKLNSFLRSLNITHPVWIESAGMFQKSEPPDIYMLEFPVRPHRKSARLRHKFPNMEALTVCAHLQLDPTCHGLSTVFSYAISSFIKEFQLQARITGNEPVQLALLVHGSNTTYITGFPNDASWHFVCASLVANSGKWSIWVDGTVVGSGNSLNSLNYIGGDGLFMIGQDQETYGGYNGVNALCGNVTQLYMWDRLLVDTEIQSMEKVCSPVPSGLFFKWNESALEIETSLQTRRRNSPCQGSKSQPPVQLISGLHHNFSVLMPNKVCVTFDPASGTLINESCRTQRGSICLFPKEQLDFLDFPGTSFFSQVSNEFHSKPNTENTNVTLFSENELTRHIFLLSAILRIMDSNADIITRSDLLYLAETIEKAAQLNKIAVPTEVFISMIRNCLELVSRLIDPDMAEQWEDLRDHGNYLGPLIMVENIDKLLWTLADELWAERKSFTMSTKNMDIHLEPRGLAQMSCSCVFKPSLHSGQFSSHDEIIIPESEMQRVFSLGHKEVMLIYTYYSNLVEKSKLEVKTPADQQTSGKRHHTGQLDTAVISATVRDVLSTQNVPVSVQYTLSSGIMAEYSKRVTPVCVFWNIELMAGHTSAWSNKGCRVLPSPPDVTSCFCNHTTNFAVLMNYMEPRWSAKEESILTKLTFIGSGASLCALVVTLMLFTVLDIPKSDRTSVHKNLFVSLTCAQIVLLCSGSAVHNKVACMLVAALMHLFFMAAFSWMLVEGLLLWSKVVSVNLSEDRHMKYYYLIGWGLPVLIVTITLASASGNYSADGHCWLSVQNGVIWGFAGPVIFIIMVNIMILTRVVLITIGTAKRRSLMMNNSPEEQVSEQIRAAVKAVLVLLPILGLTWLCGVLVPFSVVIAYIFSLLNSLQGLFIFLIYGVYNTEVRNTVNRIKERRKALNFSNCASSRPSSSVGSSRPGSSPVPGVLDGHTVTTSHSSSSSTHSDNITQSFDKTRHLSLLCVHDNLNEDLRCPDTGVHLSGQENLEKPKSRLPNECSLNVPMEAERISPPQQNANMCLY